MQIDADVMVAKADMIKRCKLPVIIDTWGRIDPRKGVSDEAFRVLLDLDLATTMSMSKFTAPIASSRAASPMPT